MCFVVFIPTNHAPFNIYVYYVYVYISEYSMYYIVYATGAFRVGTEMMFKYA